MAIGWVSMLKMVPWGDVISNAPGVAQGAKKLWDTVSRKPQAAEGDAAGQSAKAGSAADAIKGDGPLLAMQARLAEAESSIAALHDQMQASSALIKALAEQNTELIARVELHRLRVRWLSISISVLAALGLVAVISLAMTLTR